jgi:hypothetical protein
MTWLLLGVFGTIASLAIPVIVVVLVVRAGRHERAAIGSPGAPVRRFFQYGLMLTALVLAAVGLDMLGRAAFEAEGMIGRGSARVATPLALVLVGAPLFAGLALWTRRRMEADPGERLSVGWLLYLTATLVGSLVVAAIALSSAISAAFGVSGARGAAWVTALVWAAVWAGHWTAAARRVPADGSRSHRLLGSLVGLTAVLTTVIALGAIVATWVYRQLLSDTLVSSLGRDLRELAGPLFVSLLVWWWYWLRTTRRQSPTVGWNAYVLLGGVLGGLLIVVVTAGVVVFAVLSWLIGDPGAVGAVDHFAVVPGTAFAAAIGALSWRYHRDVLRGSTEESVDEVARIYIYLLAAVGLAAAAIGVTTLIVAVIEIVTRGTVIGGAGGSGNVALGGLTLLVVGVPLWWSAWSSVHRSGRDQVEERSSLSRRLYLSGSFGLGGVIAVVSLIGVVAAVLEDLLDGSLGSATLDGIRVQLALVITIGAVAAYHWRVFREDRALGPERVRALERLVLVAPGDAAALGRSLAERTGARVEVWRSEAEAAGSTVSVDAVASAVGSLVGSEGAVVVHSDGRIEVVEARRLT